MRLFPATLLYAIVPSFYFPDTLGFSVSAILPSENKISFPASFLICLHVVSLSCFIVWTTVMNRRSKWGHNLPWEFFLSWLGLDFAKFLSWINWHNHEFASQIIFEFWASLTHLNKSPWSQYIIIFILLGSVCDV